MIQINRISLSQNGYKVLGTRDDGIEVEFETTDNKTLKEIIELVDKAKTKEELEEERRSEIENQALLAQAELFERIIKLEEGKEVGWYGSSICDINNKRIENI